MACPVGVERSGRKLEADLQLTGTREAETGSVCFVLTGKSHALHGVTLGVKVVVKAFALGRFTSSVEPFDHD
jgi:hypothetical protein